jgi:5-methyltetrahydropteroyltriglutamate--homocysteine methyltransferase
VSHARDPDLFALEAGNFYVQLASEKDHCGSSPFGDDTSTSRETAFATIQARVEGTRLAAQALGA